MNYIKHFIRLLGLVLLTILTQVGAIIYFIYKPLGLFINRKIRNKWHSRIIRWSCFSIIYCSATLFIIPPIAKYFGRVQLPLFATKESPIQPRTLWFCLLNRTYVKPTLYNAILRTAKTFTTSKPEYQDTYISYFDSGFPFFDNFPLLPHLSHHDGGKIDVALMYNDAKTKKRINSTPSPIGYGVSEEPKDGERNRPLECAENGYIWYSFMKNYIISQAQKANFSFDEEATANYLRILAEDKSIGKILIEPHIKQRLKLQGIDKIRLHGCQAVRHDDHIHFQL